MSYKERYLKKYRKELIHCKIRQAIAILISYISLIAGILIIDEYPAAGGLLIGLSIPTMYYIMNEGGFFDDEDMADS